MKYSLTTEHLSVTDTDVDLIDKKLERLEKLLTPPFQVSVVLRHDTHHRQGNVITCRINITQHSKVFYAERLSDSVQNALDDAVAALKKEITKYKEKNNNKR